MMAIEIQQLTSLSSTSCFIFCASARKKCSPGNTKFSLFEQVNCIVLEPIPNKACVKNLHNAVHL